MLLYGWGGDWQLLIVRVMDKRLHGVLKLISAMLILSRYYVCRLPELLELFCQHLHGAYGNAIGHLSISREIACAFFIDYVFR